MAINFFKYLYKGYKRERYLEKPRYIFKENVNYVLFSGTALGDDGDVRHLNDLYLILYLLKNYKIKKDNITLSVDPEILEELKNNSLYNDKIYTTINEQVSNIISPETFQKEYNRDLNKNLIFIASGHGDIGGLHLTKSDTFISSDYFEDISSKTNDTLLIMSQCYAGAFHHLDTRKNICVLASSDYQESLSLNLIQMLATKGEDNKFYFKENINPDLGNFMLNELSFNNRHNINPFLFSLFLVLLEPNKYIKSRKKHLINVYKNVIAITTQNLSNTYHHVKLQDIKGNEIETQDETISYKIEGIRIVQQSYLLNKIMASRFYIKENKLDSD